MRYDPRCLRPCGPALLGLLLALAGCGKKPRPSTAPAPVPLVRINDTGITLADFEAEARRRMESKRPIPDAETLLREMIEREVMLLEARKSEWVSQPEVQRELENQLLVRWLDRALQVEMDKVTVSDDDLRAAYEARRDEFTQPAMVRLAVLVRNLSPGASDETRASLRAELEKARAAYLTDPDGARRNGRMTGFGAIAADASEDDVSRYRGGDLGWLDSRRPQLRWPEEVIRVGFSLEPGAVSGVLETGTGLFVIMKSDARPAQVTPFEDVAVSLRRRVLRERQDALKSGFVSNLLARQTIEIDPVQSARLQVPTHGAPTPAAPSLRPMDARLPVFTGNTPNQPLPTP